MTKYLFLTALLFLGILTLNAQETRNIADLDFLYHAIQKMPSYKDQLKHDKNYEQLYENLRKDLNTNDDFEVFQRLARLIYPIKDNHLGFKRQTESGYKSPFVKPEADLRALEKKYANFPKDSIEGIYYSQDGKYKYFIYPKDKLFYLHNVTDNILLAVLKPTYPGHFDGVQFNIHKSPYSLRRNITISNGVLNDYAFTKDTNKAFVELIVGDNKFEYKKLDNDVGYLRLSSFAANNENFKRATELLNDVKSNLIVKNLIVDVRNNGGGADRTSDQFVSYLGNFKGKVYIIQNSNTASNAEQFVKKLKGKAHIRIFGETTLGMLTYGSNYGKWLALPSNRFSFHPTDMRGSTESKKDLAFESIGIKPDVELNPISKDWIEQVLDYINKD